MIVKDPASGRFYRFRPLERFLVLQFDGATPLEEIRRRTEQEFSGTLDLQTLAAFAAKLEHGRLLGEPRTPKKGEKPRMKRLRGTVLYLRVALLDPDRLLDRIEPHIRFCFTPAFFAFTLPTILLAIAVTAANTPQMTHDLTQLTLAELPFVITIAILVVSSHEFAHGLTCKHHGGHVHEMGFMLVYFQPFFYCNVSDAWLLPEKAKRLWVGFAGLYFELFVWALAALTWRVTETGTAVNFLALTVMAVSGLKSVFDLNPFIKLDGYYIVSDFLEIPNLRRRSFKYFGDLIRRLFGGEHPAASTLSRRDRYVLLIYGGIATVSSFILLAVGLVKAGGALIDHHQPAALMLLVTYAGMRVARRLKRLFFQRTNAITASDATAALPASPASPLPVPPGEPPAAAPPASRPARVRRAWRKSGRRLAWVGLVAAACWYVATHNAEVRVTGPFTVLPERNADVRSEVDGIVDVVRVDEGSRVKAGDLLARLSDRDLRAELAKTRADIDQAQALLRKQVAGPTQGEIDLAKAGVTKAADAARFAQNRVDRLGELYKRGVVSDQEWDDALQQQRLTVNDRTTATDQLRVLTQGTRAEDIDATKAQIEGLTTHERAVSAQLQLLNIVSPATGVVATPTREMRELRGRHVNKGDLIMKVYQVRTVTAQMIVGERELADVAVGQPVVLRARAHPDVVFNGVVTSIATAAEGMSSNSSEAPGAVAPAAAATGGNSFVVTTEIDNQAGVLKAGMTGLAKISCGSGRILSVMGKRIARTFKVEVWSWL